MDSKRYITLKTLLSVVILSVILLSAPTLYAQRTGGFNRNQMLLPDTTSKGPMDSLGSKKKNRIRKPLTSALFPDSLKKSLIYMWNIDMSNATIKMKPIDTTLNNFEKAYPFLKKNPVGAAYIGPLGAAATPLDYSKRYNYYANSFINVYGDYFFTPENVDFYNGKRPFTQFEYITAGQRQYAQEHFYVNHAQNISPSSSFDLKYQNNRKRGSYSNQQAIDKNLSFNFAHTGKRYTVFMGYINNIARINENGGVQDISNITDTTIGIPSTILVNMKASNIIKGNQFYLTQSYAIPLKGTKIDSTTNFSAIPSLAIGMSFNYSAYRKIYQDTKNRMKEGYYEHWYYNSSSTRDSINEKHTDLNFFVRYQPYNKYGIIGNITAGLGLSSENYYNFNQDSYFNPDQNVRKNSTYLYGDIDGGYYQYLRWNAHAKYFFAGYRSQDISVGGEISLLFGKKHNPIKLSAAALIASQTPSYWSMHYNSNHYIWDNNFAKEFKMQYDFTFLMERINLELGFTQTLETDKVYYNEKALPSQFDGTVSVSSIYARKDFVWKGFHFKHRGDLQFSSNQDVAPVPLLALNLTYFYDITVVKNVLNIHFGVDGFYNTKYYGFGYNPAIGQFYNQRNYKMGNYPWLDVFAEGKWKRLRFILKLQHVNFGMSKNRNYIQVADYPLDRMMFTFGFSWSFYD